jgi:hypothetical protein
MDAISASESCGIGETCFMDLSGNPTILHNRIRDSRTINCNRRTENDRRRKNDKKKDRIASNTRFLCYPQGSALPRDGMTSNQQLTNLPRVASSMPIFL